MIKMIRHALILSSLLWLAIFALISVARAADAQPPPFAVYFCMRQWAECAAAPAATIASSARSRVAAINDAVNWRIAPLFGPAMLEEARKPWRILEQPGSTGVCKDYAITKRHDLVAAGFPSGALSLAYLHVARADATMNHLVLLVRFDDGIYVLDNQTNILWEVDEENSYEWISRQAWGEPQKWVAMKDAT